MKNNKDKIIYKYLQKISRVHPCKSAAKFFFLLLIFSNPVFSQDQKKFLPEQIQNSQLKGGEKHFYNVYAEAGSCLRFTIVQNGIDVVITIKNKNDEILKKTDRPSGSFGRETVTFIAAESGDYIVEISTWLKFAPVGEYVIGYTTANSPNDADRKRDAAENLTSEAEDLRGVNDENSKRSAIEKFTEVLQLWKDLGDDYEQGVIYYGLGYTHYTLSEFTRAAIYYNRAIKIHSETKDEFALALNYSSLASVQFILNESGLSVYNFQKAIKIYRKIGVIRNLGVALAGLGAVQSLLEQNDDAVKSLNESLKYRELTNDENGKAKTLTTLGKIYLGRNEFGKAETSFLEAKNSYEKADRPIEAELLLFFGRLYYKTGRFEKASEILDKGLSKARRTGNKLGEANVLLEKSRAEYQLKNHEPALRHARNSIRLIESIRNSTLDFRVRLKFTETIQPFYENYILLLMRMHENAPDAGFDKIALQTGEQARFRGLLDQLERREFVRQGKIKPELLERERILRDELTNVLELSESDSSKSAKIREISAAYLETEAEINTSTATFNEIVLPPTLNAEEIQAHLDENSVILEYLLIDEQSFLWLISNKEIKSFRLPKLEIIEDAARAFYKCLEKPTADEKICRRNNRRLSEILLGQIGDEINGKKLIVVKHGFLQYIPFAALQTVKTGGETGFLIETNEITSLPSASILGFIQKKRNTSPKKMLAVFADPIYSASDERINNPQVSAEENTSRLFASRFEAEKIASFVAPENLLIKTDGAANRQAFFDADLENYQILHFAVHTFINDKKPELSAIALSSFDERGNKMESFLQSNDILNLDLSAELVVLSSCQSGLGKQVRGEGLIALSQSFFIAGSSASIISLWDVDDKVTAELMTRFYRKYLIENESAAAALRQTQLEIMLDKRWRSPFYWSAFVLQGN